METYSTTTSILQFKGNKLKKKRIPRPLNAFIIFANKNRSQLKKMSPEKSNREISIELGQIWQKLTVVDRTPYHMESQKAVIQHRLKYPDYSYLPGSPKVKKKNVLINFAENINVAKPKKETPASTDAINPPLLKKSELTVQVQNTYNTTEHQFESSMKEQFIPQPSNDPLRKRSTINIPPIHQFFNANQLTAVPNMSWVPWTPTWPYLPVAPPQPYRIFPTSTFNNSYPYMYNQQFFPGQRYSWPPSTSLSCFYPRDFQMNDNCFAPPIVNNQFSLENMCNNNQTESFIPENGKYYSSPNGLNSDQQQQIFSGINFSRNTETVSHIPSTDMNYQPEEENEDDIQIDVTTP